MGLRSLVSLILVLFPIGATLGVLLGLDQYRVSRGFTPIFQDNSVDTKQYCQKSYGVTVPSVGQQYTLNPNQWNWNVTDPGGACMKVTMNANDTYATPTSAPEWSVTWQYPPGPTDFPVHAFPNIRLDATDTFPILLKDTKSIPIRTKWTYSVGHKPSKKLNTVELTKANLNANVAIDMFLSIDKTQAQSTLNSQYEIMVWLGQFGPGTLPIGFNRKPKPIVDTRTVDNVEFNLYYGRNSFGQLVFTWVTSSTKSNNFDGDIFPLLENLSQWGGPGPDHYLGYMGMGSETYNSDKTVTLSVPTLEMVVKKN